MKDWNAYRNFVCIESKFVVLGMSTKLMVSTIIIIFDRGHAFIVYICVEYSSWMHLKYITLLRYYINVNVLVKITENHNGHVMNACRHCTYVWTSSHNTNTSHQYGICSGRIMWRAKKLVFFLVFSSSKNCILRRGILTTITAGHILVENSRWKIPKAFRNEYLNDHIKCLGTFVSHLMRSAKKASRKIFCFVREKSRNCFGHS